VHLYALLPLLIRVFAGFSVEINPMLSGRLAF